MKKSKQNKENRHSGCLMQKDIKKKKLLIQLMKRFRLN